MNNLFKKIHIQTLFLFLGILSLFVISCTKNFTEINTNPVGISDEQGNADFALIAQLLAQAQRDIIPEDVGEYQLANNLTSDAYAGYLAAQAPFVGNANNLTYSLVPGWYASIFVDRYIKAMNPLYKVIISTRQNDNLKDIFAFTKILQVAAMHRTSDKIGPIIYSKYNIPDADGTIPFDSQEATYQRFFADLDTAVNILKGLQNAPISPAMKKSDLAYSANNYQLWLRFANTLRLRLAIRIAYVKPDIAKTQGEKALDPTNGGLLESSADNCYIKLSTNHPLNIITTSWSDTRLGATFESFLVGYKDPRLEKLFLKAEDTNVAGQFKGIRSGIEIDAKSRYDSYSKLIALPNKMQLMVSAEAWFLKAEAALRGWTNAGNAKTNYENGVKESFSMYNLSSQYNTYINDNTSKPNPYVDPKSVNAKQNDIPSGSPLLSTITIKWDDAATNAKKLERIITQKWIAIFPDGDEAWAEYRRTGYPMIFPNVVNYSAGKISTEIGVRRMPFPEREYNSNKKAVEEAVKLLGGPDHGGTRLWWDTPTKNF